MWRLIATRLAAFVPTILATSLVLFITVNVVPGSAAKAALSVIATILGAVPSFWLATVLILILAPTVKVLPAGGYAPFTEDPLKNLSLLIMPALSLGVVSSALLLRIMRAKLIEVLSSDYIHTAMAKGAAPNVVIRRHALRNALITFLTVGAVEFGWLFGGVVIIEDIFLLPGVGQLVLVGIINRDYPVLLASALTVTVVVLAANMLVDLVAAILDPRQVHVRSQA